MCLSGCILIFVSRRCRRRRCCCCCCCYCCRWSLSCLWPCCCLRGALHTAAFAICVQRSVCVCARLQCSVGGRLRRSVEQQRRRLLSRRLIFGARRAARQLLAPSPCHISEPPLACLESMSALILSGCATEPSCIITQLFSSSVCELVVFLCANKRKHTHTHFA